jgi:hypothetical protein
MTNTDGSARQKIGRMKVLVPWIFVGLTVGGLGGAVLANRVVNRNARAISQTLAVSEYQNLALLQYKYAAPDLGRKSMRDLLIFMDLAEASQLAPDKKTLDFDRSLTYMRLALLDEKSGDAEAFQRDFAAAAEYSKRLGNKDTSEPRLRQVAAKLDSYLP